jgi:uncharacterized membrane protein
MTVQQTHAQAKSREILHNASSDEAIGGRLGRAVGYVRLGLGAAQLVAPRTTARIVGLRPKTSTAFVMRLLGVREILSGLGLLSSKRLTRWLWMRLAGDAIDLAYLGQALYFEKASLKPSSSHETRLQASLASVAGIAALDALALHSPVHSPSPRTHAMTPSLTASLTINRTPAEVYAFWRTYSNLPRFMEYVQSVTEIDARRSHWVAAVPVAGTIEWRATLIEDQPDHRIAWRVDPVLKGWMIDSGEVRFQPAPGQRGTEVHLTLWGSRSHAPATVTKWLKKIPERYLTNQLHRLKQLLEVGEITLSDSSIHTGPHPARPSAHAQPPHT